MADLAFRELDILSGRSPNLKRDGRNAVGPREAAIPALLPEEMWERTEGS